MSIRPVTEDDLNGYVDDALTAERRAEVVSYLAAHPETAARIEAFRAERDMLRAALAPVAEEPLPPELDLQRMIEARARPSWCSQWRTAAAAVLLLAVGAGAGWMARGFQTPPAEGLQALGQEASASYAVFAPDRARPVEIRAEDRAQLAAWTSRRLGRPVAIPDLAAAGYRFMGGRVVATEHGPAALFMYDDDQGKRLVMLARPMKADAEAPMTPHAGHGVHGFSWSDDGLGYSLVGDDDPAALHPVADIARRQIRKQA